ncbi:hypothetical protein [Bradyrhizobium sp.]|uniref:hypothetical protein n=1 Tax=Bradyrhizobium sp. TaxID=376 RepID=UPI003D0A6322
MIDQRLDAEPVDEGQHEGERQADGNTHSGVTAQLKQRRRLKLPKTPFSVHYRIPSETMIIQIRKQHSAENLGKKSPRTIKL